MLYGYFDIIILIIIFIGIQLWWIIPIFNKNKLINRRKNNLRGEIDLLEKIYKK